MFCHGSINKYFQYTVDMQFFRNESNSTVCLNVLCTRETLHTVQKSIFYAYIGVISDGEEMDLVKGKTHSSILHYYCILHYFFILLMKCSMSSLHT